MVIMQVLLVHVCSSGSLDLRKLGALAWDVGPPTPFYWAGGDGQPSGKMMVNVLLTFSFVSRQSL